MRIVLLDDFSPFINQTLSNWNWQVINGQNWTLEDFKKNSSQLEGIIIRSIFSLDREHLTLAKKLKFIARPGSGLENIDLKYCEENDIDTASVGPLINKSLKEKIKEEAEKLNLVERSSTAILPI